MVGENHNLQANSHTYLHCLLHQNFLQEKNLRCHYPNLESVTDSIEALEYTYQKQII